MEVNCANLTIEGVSRSTIETYFNIKELNLVFDIGKCPFHLVPVPNVFISHMHGDHSMGLYYYVSHRNLARMTPGKIYLPEEAVPGVENWFDDLSGLEGARRNYELVPLQVGDEFEYGRNHIIKTFATDHRIASLGYQIISKKEKLKPELIGKSSSEIVALKKKGEKITNTLLEPLITYVGDSTILPVDQYDFIKKSKILIIECTFIADEHYDQAVARKHIHLKDIIDRAEEFENDHIILSHFSMRYSNDWIRKTIYRRLPDCLKEKVIVFV